MESSLPMGSQAPLIFLDIDGVLNDHAFNEGAQSTGFLPACVARLNRVLEAVPEARIVLSSAWRYMVIGRAMSLVGFDYLLRTHGVAAGRLVGRTPADEEVEGRGWQIQRWRQRFDHRGPYVVLDDLDLAIAGLHSGRFVQTDGAAGLSDADADRAVAVLKGLP